MHRDAMEAAVMKAACDVHTVVVFMPSARSLLEPTSDPYGPQQYIGVTW